MVLRLSIRAILLSVIAISSQQSFAQSDESDLTAKSFLAWRDHILPFEADLSWREIPWLTTFQDGVLDANHRNLPLLFWTMNGHPLGCT